jgi:hypothetical protein
VFAATSVSQCAGGGHRGLAAEAELGGEPTCALRAQRDVDSRGNDARAELEVAARQRTTDCESALNMYERCAVASAGRRLIAGS